MRRKTEESTDQEGNQQRETGVTQKIGYGEETSDTRQESKNRLSDAAGDNRICIQALSGFLLQPIN